jgi:hypothetical protein
MAGEQLVRRDVAEEGVGVLRRTEGDVAPVLEVDPRVVPVEPAPREELARARDARQVTVGERRLSTAIERLELQRRRRRNRLVPGGPPAHADDVLEKAVDRVQRAAGPPADEDQRVALRPDAPGLPSAGGPDTCRRRALRGPDEDRGPVRRGPGLRHDLEARAGGALEVGLELPHGGPLRRDRAVGDHDGGERPSVAGELERRDGRAALRGSERDDRQPDRAEAGPPVEAADAAHAADPG